MVERHRSAKIEDSTKPDQSSHGGKNNEGYDICPQNKGKDKPGGQPYLEHSQRWGNILLATRFAKLLTP